MNDRTASPGSRTREIYLRDESYLIIGACIEVHTKLGHGFVEPVYQESLQIELERRRIPFQAQVKLPVFYRDQKLESEFRPDFICYNKIVVEIKSKRQLVNQDASQVLNYLRVTGFKLGLLVNFGSDGLLERQRIVL